MVDENHVYSIHNMWNPDATSIQKGMAVPKQQSGGHKQFFPTKWPIRNLPRLLLAAAPELSSDFLSNLEKSM